MTRTRRTIRTNITVTLEGLSKPTLNMYSQKLNHRVRMRMQRQLMPQMMMCCGGMVITVVLSGRLRKQSTFLGCAIIERRQGTSGAIVLSL